MKKYFSILWIILSQFIFSQATWQEVDYEVIENTCPNQSNEIYISEIYDSKGGDYGLIELYNPTPNPITLTNVYRIARYGNLADTTTSTYYTPTGVIQPYSTFVIIIGSNAGAVGYICPNYPPPQTSQFSGFNENDKLELEKSNVVIDRLQTPNYVGYVMRRNPNAITPQTTYNPLDWTIVTINNNSNLGCTNIGVHNPNLSINVTNLEQRTDGAYGICKIPARFRVYFNGGSGSYHGVVDGATWNTTLINSPNQFGIATFGPHTYTLRDANNQGCTIKIRFFVENPPQTSPILQN